MATWYVLIDSAGDPASISTSPIPSPPAGMSVKEFTSDGQPNIGEWFDPVNGGSMVAAKTWDRASRSWGALITPQVVDRILGDLAGDEVLLAVWQRLTVAQRDALRTRLAQLLGRRRYRYANEPVNLDD